MLHVSELLREGFIAKVWGYCRGLKVSKFKCSNKNICNTSRWGVLGHICLRAKSTYYLHHVCLSVCVYQLSFHWLDFCAVFYSRILQSVEEFKIWLQLDKNIRNGMWGRSTVYCCWQHKVKWCQALWVAKQV